nr:immunoglobulin heavy chain junction region [Mus musculus]MBK4198528.1 immunoglobulin heavy chain junction region [Mus musculus]MBK4198529.1 immunoglobulin heavy chain junction region [Mus musculus]MBK4198530.1 immunoglobulin heavy chain junction region [Mus musculus]MBK4198531.1 immunoglobulin heavy chain junction region [Mus musculus]
CATDGTHYFDYW